MGTLIADETGEDVVALPMQWQARNLCAVHGLSDRFITRQQQRALQRGERIYV